MAAVGGHAKTSALLCEHGGRLLLLSSDKSGYIALHVACLLGHLNVVDTLLHSIHGITDGIDVVRKGATDGSTALHIVARAEQNVGEITIRLLEAEADLLTRDCFGMTALHRACTFARLPFVREILRTDAVGTETKLDCLRARDDDGCTVLHSLCQAVCLPTSVALEETLLLLIAARADVNARDAGAGTPLHVLCGSGARHQATSLPTIKALLQAHADLAAESCLGWTALHVAHRAGASGSWMVALLESHCSRECPSFMNTFDRMKAPCGAPDPGLSVPKRNDETDIVAKTSSYIPATPMPDFSIQHLRIARDHADLTGMHEGVFCNVCASSHGMVGVAHFIKGKRFKCLECLDVDLCEQHMASCVEDHDLNHTLVPLSPAVCGRFQDRKDDSLLGHFVSYHEAFYDRPLIGIPKSAEHKTYSWCSYAKMFSKARSIALALQSLRQELHAQRPLVGICLSNCIEWMVFDFACLLLGWVSVGIYPNTHATSIQRIVDKCKLAMAFCHDDSVTSFVNAGVPISIVVPSPSYANRMDTDVDLCSVYKGHVAHAMQAGMQNLGKRVRQMQLQDLEAMQPSAQSVKTDDRDDVIFTLFNTSGSTGSPKLVVRSRLAWKKMLLEVERGARQNSDPFMLRMLVSSLAHSGARNTLWSVIAAGGSLALHYTGGVDMLEAACLLRPTSLFLPPLIWATVHTDFLAAVAGGEPRESAVKRVRQELYGLTARSRAIAVGGAPVPHDLRAFMEEIVPFSLVQSGYGTTEVGGISSDDNIDSGVELRLLPIVDDAEANDQSQASTSCTRGEVCVRTAEPFEGYFADPQSTAAAVTKEGLYRTGDLGEFDSQGRLRILGRLHSTVKLANAKFVCLDDLESLYHGQCPSAQQMCLHADVPRNAIVAIVVPVGHTKPRSQDILAELVVAAATHNLPAYEIPCGVVIAREFTMAAGLLTQTNKLCRTRIVIEYKREVEDVLRAVYGRAGGEVVEELLRAASGLDSSLHEDTLLASLGMDSLRLARLSGELQRRGSHVSVSMLANIQTVAQLRSLVQKRDTSVIASVLDRAHADKETLIDGLRFRRLVGDNSDFLPESAIVLVTGATGFMGIHLAARLAELDTVSKVICLVREHTDENGAVCGCRLHAVADWYGVPRSQKWQAIHGDLSLPSFGLEEATWQQLCDCVDSVWHLGAIVDWSLAYDTLRAVNVLGTTEVLKFCSSGRKVKPLVFASTFSDRADNEPVTFDTLRAVAPSGYGLSKMVAEALVQDACSRGLPCLILRCGLITWHRRTGACNIRDVLSRIVICCLKLGAAYDVESEAQDAMDGLPVDVFVESAISMARSHKQQSIFAFSLSTARQSEAPILYCRTLFAGIRQSGYNLETCGYAEWRQRAHSALSGFDAGAILPHLPVKSPPLLLQDKDECSCLTRPAKDSVITTSDVERMVLFLTRRAACAKPRSDEEGQGTV
eukprot:TRINITY_DN26928_c0_g2_i1.p1 TRINITY_DN26928_c0_g2~~TRINITY_DN26928_c0_g2_i1.p1  ORF type:complete len:1626 (+),score=181.04 TRINITY_DN26928_c0_g2_i1:529-4878(+)